MRSAAGTASDARRRHDGSSNVRSAALGPETMQQGELGGCRVHGADARQRPDDRDRAHGRTRVDARRRGAERAARPQPSRPLRGTQEAPGRGDRARPDRDVAEQRPFAAAPPGRQPPREIGCAAEPFQPGRVAVAIVEGQTAAADEHQRARGERRHEQRAERRGSRRPVPHRRPRGGRRDRQREEHRHEEPCGSASASPPHREMRDGEKIRDEDEQQLEADAARLAIPDHHAQPGKRAGERRRVGEQAEPLVEEQPGEAARDERHRSRLVRVRRQRVGRPVNRDEEPDPADRARGRHAQERDRLSRGIARSAQAEQHQRSKAPSDERKPCVQPWQHGQCRAVQPPGTGSFGPAFGLLLRAQERPDAGQRDHAARTVRVHHEAVKDAARREGHGGPAEPRRIRAPCHDPGEMPRERRAGRGEDYQKHLHAAVARDGECRGHEHRQPRGVNRVDLAVAPEAAEIRLRQLPREERPVVSAVVVVLDPQIAILQKALGDDQVVRLVAARD